MLNSGLSLGLPRTASTDVVAVVKFATPPIWFLLGTELGNAGHRLSRAQRMKERKRIMGELAESEFPKGGVVPKLAVMALASLLSEHLGENWTRYADKN